uniref:Uncharacterized protein n=1 Tax=Lotus japonicus TaxID=34305 RepID=I3SFY6_LOTJA|nr:unknown [Lotus japonicus]
MICNRITHLNIKNIFRRVSADKKISDPFQRILCRIQLANSVHLISIFQNGP